MVSDFKHFKFSSSFSSTREYCCENIKLKLLGIKNIKRSSVEMWNMWFVLLYQYIEKYGYAGTLILTKMYQFIV